QGSREFESHPIRHTDRVSSGLDAVRYVQSSGCGYGLSRKAIPTRSQCWRRLRRFGVSAWLGRSITFAAHQAWTSRTSGTALSHRASGYGSAWRRNGLPCAATESTGAARTGCAPPEIQSSSERHCTRQTETRSRRIGIEAPHFIEIACAAERPPAGER